VAAVAKTMAEREEFLQDIRFRLEQAQAIQKRHYDKNHREVSYVVDDWVLLRLRHRSIASLEPSPGKLKPRFFGPYQVTEVINAVAVRVALPARARLHDVFHVGLLKKWQGDPPTSPPPLPVIHNGATVPEPERLERSRLARGVRQVLVRWKGEPFSSSPWEDWDTFRERFPTFQLKDELVQEEGRDVMYGNTYSRRRRARDVRRAAECAQRVEDAAQESQEPSRG